MYDPSKDKPSGVLSSVGPATKPEFASNRTPDWGKIEQEVRSRNAECHAQDLAFLLEKEKRSHAACNTLLHSCQGQLEDSRKRVKWLEEENGKLHQILSDAGRDGTGHCRACGAFIPGVKP